MTDDTEDPADWWNGAYEGRAYDGDPPWDTGEPQSALADLADAGTIEGRVLDAGCGTGTEALFLAERGHDVTGVDFSEVAVERARAKARERDADATFRVDDALDLDSELGPFDTAVDSGLFHAFTDSQRERYGDSLARVVRPGGRAAVLSFGAGAPKNGGPRPVAASDIRSAFTDGWRVAAVRDAPFETNAGAVPGCLAVLERA